MAGKVEARLKTKGVELPVAPAPAANYVPFVVSGSLLFVSGQVPVENGRLAFIGTLGRDFGVEQGQAAARLCAVNILAQAKAALGGDLDRIKRCVRLGGFVRSTDDFTGQPEVVNGASDLMVEAFGEAGKHARAAVGTNALPRGVAVEVEAIFEIT